MQFNEQLAFLRRARGISQENLAEQLGVSRQAVSKWETGTSQPELGNILALCRILEVTPNELLDADMLPSEAPVPEQIPPEADAAPAKASWKKPLTFAAVMGLCILLVLGLGITKWQKEREGISPKIESCHVHETRALDNAREFTIQIVYSRMPENQTYEIDLDVSPHISNIYQTRFDVEIQDHIGYVTFLVPYGAECTVNHVSNAEAMSYQQNILKITECTANTYDQELLVK